MLRRHSWPRTLAPTESFPGSSAWWCWPPLCPHCWVGAQDEPARQHCINLKKKPVKKKRDLFPESRQAIPRFACVAAFLKHHQRARPFFPPLSQKTGSCPPTLHSKKRTRNLLPKMAPRSTARLRNINLIPFRSDGRRLAARRPRAPDGRLNH